MEDEVFEQLASHSEEVQTTETPDTPDVDINAALREFGIIKDEPMGEDQDEPEQDEELEPEDEPPAIADEPKKLRVKVNKEEIEVDDDQIPELVQKGFGLDKERQRRTEAEQALQRAAKLAGFETADEYLANLDKIEQQAIQKKQDDFDLLKQQLREDAESAGIDPDYLDRYLDAHPLLQQAREVVERESKSQEIRQQEDQQQQLLKGWEELFNQHPELVENAPAEGEKPDWLTTEMDALIEQGYKPIHAFELTNRDKFLAAERKRAEQDVIKKQRLNKRSQVVTQASAEMETEVPQEVASAFAAFDMNPKLAPKYMKK
ncbi:hypothetical protein [Paenibacillus polymyxa]|uniref:hypothetical protein n=1 Tax=Paenibacillus polymyxa TaxID=1406 RepID=UPI00129A6C53|nr:hypothetical protein [Paenibacillus polymyxa]KAE8559791.1 hypothetical protein BJH92_12485 [Paenibacillus polymyxa]MCJ1222269.1 hypothetical protein [Paenibacillus polymyxa]